VSYHALGLICTNKHVTSVLLRVHAIKGNSTSVCSQFRGLNALAMKRQHLESVLRRVCPRSGPLSQTSAVLGHIWLYLVLSLYNIEMLAYFSHFGLCVGYFCGVDACTCSFMHCSLM